MLEARCPHCKESLMDSNNVVKGFPGICVDASWKEGETHRIWLNQELMFDPDAAPNAKKKIIIPHQLVVECFCPHCKKELSNGAKTSRCGRCRTPMITFEMTILVKVCSSSGCNNHGIGELPDFFDDDMSVVDGNWFGHSSTVTQRH